jgi:hypothetical protein
MKAFIRICNAIQFIAYAGFSLYFLYLGSWAIFVALAFLLPMGLAALALWAAARDRPRVLMGASVILLIMAVSLIKPVSGLIDMTNSDLVWDLVVWLVFWLFKLLPAIVPCINLFYLIATRKADPDT